FYDLEEKTKNRSDNQKVTLNVKMSRQGNKILELDHVSQNFGEIHVIEDFSYVFKKGDRIGLAGKNGSGKSSLLNIITQHAQPSAGKVDVGDTTVFGYYKQGGLEFDPKERVIDVVKSQAEYIQMADGQTISASQLLTLFLFPPKKQHGFVERLSGGEKKRLQLMRVLMLNPNFLILDEPTNDLDIDTLNVLEDFLENFAGILLLVSHDRYLLDKMSDQLFILDGSGKVRVFNGNYSDFRNEVAQQEKPVPNTPVVKDKKVSGLTFSEKRELEELTNKIDSAQTALSELSKSIENPPSDLSHLNRLITEHSELQTLILQLEDRWLELSEKE
ncbi:MAG: ABC transporter ATP-binding protein, partial [Chitinophagaceae bacterium]